MQNRGVVLLNDHSLLSAGIESLLQSEANVQLYTVAADDPRMITKIKQRNPHAIIMDSGDASLGEGVITDLLGQHPKAKVIVLNHNRTEINVYRVHRVVKSDLDGLMEAIRGRRQFPSEEFRQKTINSADAENGGETMGT